MVVASPEREKTTKVNSSTHTFMYATNILNNQVICLCVTPDTRIVKFSHGAAIATLRCLAIQLGASLATRNNPLINTDVIDNYRIDGMPEHAEKEFLRYGIDHLMKLVKDAQPSD